MAHRTTGGMRTVRRVQRADRASPYPTSDSGQHKRVYVGNLSWDTTWQALKDHMKQAGDVVRADVLSEAGGRSKGCGLVEYRTASDAKKAIEQLHDTELLGRLIFVREDRDQGPTGVFKVFVDNLPPSVTWQELKDHMRRGGNVTHAAIIGSSNGESKGCAIVEYGSLGDAKRAIRMLNNSTLGDRSIFVREDRDQATRISASDNTRVYVGQLDYGVQWYELKDHMKLAGHVERAEIMEDANGRSKGYAIVEFANAEGAARAIAELNDTQLRDRRIFVREDREDLSSASHAGHQLFVGNLSFRTPWYVLKDHFKTVGSVEFVEVPVDGDGRPRGFGTVRYTTEEDARRAIEELNGTELEGRIIEVREDKHA